NLPDLYRSLAFMACSFSVAVNGEVATVELPAAVSLALSRCRQCMGDGDTRLLHRSGLLHLLDVEAGLDWRAETPVRLLLPVFLLDLAKVEAHLIDRALVIMPVPHCVARDQHVCKRDLEVLFLLAAGLATSEHGFLDVLARHTSQEQRGSGLA